MIILQETLLKSMLQVGSIFEPTWTHLGRVWGAKMGPSWHQDASNIDPKDYQKNDDRWHRLKIDFSLTADSALGF